MNRKWTAMAALLCAVCLSAGTAESDFIALSGPLSPQVDAVIDPAEIVIRAQNPYGNVSGRLAVAREKMKVYPLDRFPASVKPDDPALGKGALRLGLEISWFRPDGTLRQREVFLSPPDGNRLPKTADRLPVFDFAAHRRFLADRSRRIAIPVTLDKPGVVSVVIEDAGGGRVRNLVSGQVYEAGRHSIEWDGRNETGNPVAPGTYRVRGVTHPGLKQDFLMKFGNGDEPFLTAWGPNHSRMTALATDGKQIFAGARLTEGGWMLVALTPEGKFIRGYQQAHWRGADFVALAADSRYLYLLLQGRSFNGQTDLLPRLALVVYEIETGKIVPVNRKNSNFVYESRIGVDEAKKRKVDNMHYSVAEQPRILTGIAVLNGKLYLANGESNRVAVIDPMTAKTVEELPLNAPSAPAVSEGKLYVAGGKDIFLFEPEKKQFRKLFSLPFAPTSLSVRDGLFAVTGAPDSTVNVYGRNGELKSVLGEPGGAYAGAWKPKRLVNPVGVLLAKDGSVWTVEDRSNPKRVVRWNRENGEILYEKYGCPAYGSPGAGFDPEDSGRWFADGVEWRIDFSAKTAKPVELLTADERQGGVLGKPHHYQVARFKGKLYLIGTGHVTTVSEYLPDGTLKLVAALSNTRSFQRMSSTPSPAFLKAMEKAYPTPLANKRNRPPAGVFWLDRNGNGTFDEDEFEFMPDGRTVEGYWGIFSMNLSLRFPFRKANGEELVVSLEPNGFLPNGVPDYSLKRAFAEAKPIRSELPSGSKGAGLVEAFDDLRGNVIVNSTPYMLSVGKDGRLNWFFRNLWTNVHGSHNAPMPKRGELAGVLFALGVAPLDREGDVIAFNGNTGRVFFMTTDGIYLDELFADIRVATGVDPNTIGGEPFGGVFQYDRGNRRYLLQDGHGSYRIYRILNLDKIRRFSQELTVSHEQLEAALRRNPSGARTDSKAVAATLPFRTVRDLRRLPPVVNWTHGALNCRVSGAYDAENLYLRYQVDDPSPWKNTGKDWTLLFKSGDSVDFQLSLDPGMTGKKRRDAAPGDIRLLIAPFEGKNIAVLYRFRVKGDRTGLNPVDFSSPWQTYRADNVRKIESARIRLEQRTDGYTVSAQIPLSELGVDSATLKGRTLAGDFGVIFGDRDGKVNLSRSYWSNKSTGLVNDIPGEIIPPVGNWGNIKFGE